MMPGKAPSRKQRFQPKLQQNHRKRQAYPPKFQFNVLHDSGQAIEAIHDKLQKKTGCSPAATALSHEPLKQFDAYNAQKLRRNYRMSPQNNLSKPYSISHTKNTSHGLV
jgi:hypothetical protein